jgi:hypothetical protein
MCPIVGWARSKYCPTCTENPENASRKEDMYVDSEFASRGLGPYDREPEEEEHEKAWGEDDE